MKKYIVLLILLVISAHSFSQIQGKLRMTRYLFNADPDHKLIKITTNLWYFGKLSIQEIPSIDMNTNSTESALKTPVKYYLFIDSTLNSHVYFHTFSDTAGVIARSRNQDLFSKYGGWNLYANKFEYQTMQQLADTVIGGKATPV